DDGHLTATGHELLDRPEGVPSAGRVVRGDLGDGAGRVAQRGVDEDDLDARGHGRGDRGPAGGYVVGGDQDRVGLGRGDRLDDRVLQRGVELRGALDVDA